MTKSKVSLSFHCNKDWDAMEKHDKGKYCLSCKEVVTDHSRKSLEEINQLNDNPSGSCGSFYAIQLDKPFKNWKDKVITAYQRLSFANKSNSPLFKLFLYSLLVILFIFGCARKRLGGYYCPEDYKKVKEKSNAVEAQ